MGRSLPRSALASICTFAVEHFFSEELEGVEFWKFRMTRFCTRITVRAEVSAILVIFWTFFAKLSAFENSKFKILESFCREITENFPLPKFFLWHFLLVSVERRIFNSNERVYSSLQSNYGLISARNFLFLTMIVIELEIIHTVLWFDPDSTKNAFRFLFFPTLFFNCESFFTT